MPEIYPPLHSVPQKSVESRDGMTRRLSLCAAVIIFAAMFSGCGAKEVSPSDYVSPSAEISEMPTQVSVSPLPQVTLTFLDCRPNSGQQAKIWGNDEVSRQITEKTGVTLEIGRASCRERV